MNSIIRMYFSLDVYILRVIEADPVDESVNNPELSD